MSEFDNVLVCRKTMAQADCYNVEGEFQIRCAPCSFVSCGEPAKTMYAEHGYHFIYKKVREFAEAMMAAIPNADRAISLGDFEAYATDPGGHFIVVDRS